MITVVLTSLLLAVPLALAARLAWAVYRFGRLSPAAKRNYPRAAWAKCRWRWLSRNLVLARVDAHHDPDRAVRGTGGRSTRMEADGRRKIRYPRARFRATEHGFEVHLRTIPQIGRPQFEVAAEHHLPNAWRCARVSVSQPRAGRLTLAALKTDPLLEPYTQEQAPPGAFGRTRADNPLRLFMGIDAWAQPRWISLPGTTGATVAGVPGRGKTELVLSWLTQLDPLPARFAIIDGKCSYLPTSDYADWSDRAWILTGDDLEAAADALNELYQEMRRRFAMVLELTGGKRNAWHVGPTADMPLLFVVLDEVRTFFDEQAVKGDRKAEANVRACRSLAGHLVGKGRSVMVWTATVSQKQDSAATSLAVRDNSGISICFGVKTVDAAVTALGADIRDRPAFSPVRLQADEYVGCCVATMPGSGSEPYTMLRVPKLTAAPAWARARVPESVKAGA